MHHAPMRYARSLCLTLLLAASLGARAAVQSGRAIFSHARLGRATTLAPPETVVRAEDALPLAVDHAPVA